MDEQKKPRRSGFAIKLGCVGCLGLWFVGVGLLIAWSIGLGGALDTRLEDARAEVRTAQARDAEPRPVLLGESAAGNAADHYKALVYAWGQELSEEAERSVQASPELDAQRVRSLANPLPSHLLQELILHMEEGLAPSEEALTHFAAYRALTAHVREGVQQERCDWGYAYGHGYSAGIAGLICMREASQILTYEGYVSDDAEVDLQRGMEVCAFAADLGRIPTAVGVGIGRVVEKIGVRALERTLSRRTLSAEQLRRLLEFLDSLPRGDLTPVIQTDRIAFAVGVLAVAGRRVDPNVPPEDLELEDVRGAGTGFGAWFFNRELEGYDHFSKKQSDLCELPFAERVDAADALQLELAQSSYLMVGALLPEAHTVMQTLEEQFALRDALRVAVAAQLHHLAQGGFPESLEPLREALGGELPADPFKPGGGALTYARTGDEVRVYAWGEDLVDDGGARHGPLGAEEPDLVVSIRAPRKEGK